MIGLQLGKCQVQEITIRRKGLQVLLQCMVLAQAKDQPGKLLKILHQGLEHIDYHQEFKMFQVISFQIDQLNLNMFDKFTQF